MAIVGVVEPAYAPGAWACVPVTATAAAAATDLLILMLGLCCVAWCEGADKLMREESPNYQLLCLDQMSGDPSESSRVLMMYNREKRRANGKHACRYLIASPVRSINVVDRACIPASNERLGHHPHSVTGQQTAECGKATRSGDEM